MSLFGKNAEGFDKLSALLFAALLGVVLFTFQDFGLAWDEPYHERYGALIWDYIASGGANDAVLSFRNLQLYGGLFDALAHLGTKVLPFEPYAVRHLLQALSGVIGVAGVWAMARWAGGPTAGPLAGLLAAALLVATPSWFGHMAINPKDIPFASATLWSVYLMARTAALLPGLNMKTLVALGVALGFAMGVRIAGVVLLGYMGALLLAHLILAYQGKGRSVGAWNQARVIAVAAAVVLLMALALTFALWPASWANPIVHALQVLFVMPRFAAPIAALIDGQYVFSGDVPWWYAAHYLAVKLPLVLLVAAVLALAPMALNCARAWRAGERPRIFATLALVLAIAFPLAFSIVMETAHYDAERHFLFVIPPLCVWAGLGLADVLKALAKRSAPLAWGGGALVIVGLALPVTDMARLHPYPYVYYNEAVGGAAGAQGRYELDYWATSYRALAERLARLEGVTGDGPVGVYLCGPTDSAARFLPERFEMVRELDRADFYLSFTRWGCDGYIEAPVLFEVRAGGAVLGLVKDLREGYVQHQDIKVQVRIDADYPRPR